MGSIYKRGKIYWIKFYRSGRSFRESSESDKKHEAERLLKLREGDVARGVPVTPRRITLAELGEDLVADYEANERKTTDHARRRLEKHLLPFFGSRTRAGNVTAAQVARFTVKRREEGASNAEINRELEILKRAFNLALKNGKIHHRPHIALLKESNVRSGFFEREQFETVRRYLPEDLLNLVTFAYVTGWRLRSEVQSLQWSQVDFNAGWVCLDPGTTKNEEARIFPFTPDLEALLLEQKRATDRLKRDRAIICPWVFHRKGRPVKSLYKAWRTACRKAGVPGRIPHDFRRTAVRNLVRAGVPERVAMQMTGHKTRSVFERYNIVSESDLREAAKRLQAFTGTITGTMGDSERLKSRVRL